MLSDIEKARKMAKNVVGISARLNRKSLYFVARWGEDKNRQYVSFSVGKLGLQKAFQDACEKRSTELKRLASEGTPALTYERHGGRCAQLYSCWSNMRRRCRGASGRTSKNYFERGIRVCSAWDKSYTNFKDWAEESGYTEGLTIERKDVNGDYEPSNCIWIPSQDQARNRRKRQDNTSGFTGVYWMKGGWLVGWKTEDSGWRTKYFSINKYGKEEAFRLACEHREEQIQKLKDSGVYYGSEHGK